MANRTGPSNLVLAKLINDLKILSLKEKSKLWQRVAYELERSNRKRREVNLYKINQYTKDGEIALVPGKVLSLGEIDKKITVAAFRFSEAAREKINKSGKAISIQQLAKENPKGKNIRILG
ncbi:MAG: 50S ribosomal protein L18e [Candidatus Nanoarchaeia archaeon]|nr:50S ribosomal protein L18e [Candidatus Nanoarchaeia archaeon]